MISRPMMFAILFAMGTTAVSTRAEGIHDAIRRNDQQAVRDLVNASPDVLKAVDQSFYTPLHLAVAQNRKEIVAFLLAKGADIEAPLNSVHNAGQTPLCLALWPGQIDVANMLINKGANVKVEFTVFPHRKVTPLHAAVAAHNRPLVERLLKKGAAVDAQRSDGQTPMFGLLGTPLSLKDAEVLPIVMVLVRNKASITGVDDNGMTLLHLVVLKKLPETCGFLVRSGADINATDKAGQTPFALAVKIGNTSVLNMLRPAAQSKK